MDLTVTQPTPALDSPIFWALLVIREGYDYNIPNITANDDFYNPNQSVIDCGTNVPQIMTDGTP